METHDQKPLGANDPRPEVIVDFLFEDGLFFIALRNIGDRPAYQVAVQFDRPLVGAEGRELSTLPLFQNIEFFAPRKEIVAFLDTSAAFFKRGGDMKITARVTYQDAEGAEYQTHIRHDLEIYREIAYVVKPPDQTHAAT